MSELKAAKDHVVVKVDEKKVYGRWTVLERDLSKSGYVICQCLCGVKRSIAHTNLARGRSKSCGCLKIDVQGLASITHGFTGHPLHGVWRSMLGRCRNKNDKDYGGRGISVCKEWEGDFMVFYNWAVDKGYKSGLQIERENNNGNYCPENCKWATRKEQARNRRNSRIITCRGMTMTLAAFAELVGEKSDIIHFRMRNGWTEEDAIFTPFRRKVCKI